MKTFLTIALGLIFGIGSLYAQCTIVCNNLVNVSLDEFGEATLFAEQMIEGNDCPPPYEIQITDENNNIIYPYAEEITVDCGDLGDFIIVVKELTFGNECWGNLNISDPANNCDFQLPADHLPVTFASYLANNYPEDVMLNGTPIFKTPNNIFGIPEADILNGDNTLTFSSSEFSNNGLTTLDLVLMKKALYEQTPFTSLEAITADVDQSNFFGLGDIVYSRAIVLGVISDDVQNIFLHSDTDYSGIDPFDFGMDVHSFTFNSDDVVSTNFQFDKYRLGDVNNSGLKSDDDSEVRDGKQQLLIDDLFVEKGNTYEVEVRLDADVDFEGFQLGLKAHGITFNALLNTNNDDLQSNVNDELLSISYLASEVTQATNFIISLTADRDGMLSEMISINDEFYQEIVMSDLKTKNLEITFNVTSDLEDISDQDLIIYPNPVNDIIYIDTPQNFDDNSLVRLTNVQGQIVKSIIVQGSQSNIETADLASGLYILQWLYNGHTVEKKIIIQKR